MLGAQFGEVEIARGSDQQVDLIQGSCERLARHDGEGGFPDNRILDGVVRQYCARAAQLQRGGIEIANGAQPGPFADSGSVGE